MISMTEISDTARRIINAGMPNDCVGCYYPVMRGINLGDRVEKDGLTEAEAVEQLSQELARDCEFGHLRRKLGRKCMLGIDSAGLETLLK